MVSKVDALTGATLVAIHNGKESGQEVPHVHVHLVPRSHAMILLVQFTACSNLKFIYLNQNLKNFVTI